jgi:hypothetical protein
MSAREQLCQLISTSATNAPTIRESLKLAAVQLADGQGLLSNDDIEMVMSEVIDYWEASGVVPMLTDVEAVLESLVKESLNHSSVFEALKYASVMMVQFGPALSSDQVESVIDSIVANWSA